MTTLTIDRAEADRIAEGIGRTFQDTKDAIINGDRDEALKALHNHHRYLSAAELRLLQAKAVADGEDPEAVAAGHDKELPPPPEDDNGG